MQAASRVSRGCGNGAQTTFGGILGRLRAANLHAIYMLSCAEASAGGWHAALGLQGQQKSGKQSCTGVWSSGSTPEPDGQKPITCSSVLFASKQGAVSFVRPYVLKIHPLVEGRRPELATALQCALKLTDGSTARTSLSDQRPGSCVDPISSHAYVGALAPGSVEAGGRASSTTAGASHCCIHASSCRRANAACFGLSKRTGWPSAGLCLHACANMHAAVRCYAVQMHVWKQVPEQERSRGTPGCYEDAAMCGLMML